MSDMTSRAKRVGLRVALLWGALGLALLLPTAAWAGGHTIKVPPPNGVDDTANIQAALDAGVAGGSGITVQLASGKYLTQQLVTYNFHGTFKGAGKDKTIIEALPNLLVNVPDVCTGERMPNGTTNRWPSLIIFVDGNIKVSDLSIKITATHGTATTPWYMCGDAYTSLIDALRFMGQHATHVCLDGIAIEGARDDAPNSYGYNVWNGVLYAGELPRSATDLDYYFLSGTLTVQNCFFKTMTDMGVDGFLRNVRVVMGGSPSAGNVLEDVEFGIVFCSAENSSFEASYNRVESSWVGFLATDWLGDVFVPAKPSQFSIHDNTFLTTGPYADAIRLQDWQAKPWIHAMIFNNTIELKNEFMWAGIGAYNTRGTVLWNNTISGSGAAAIQVGGDEGIDTLCTVLGNHIQGFYADPSFGLAQIHLGPATSHNLVVCSNPLDTVLDQGTHNKIIGGWPQTAASVEPLGLKAAPNTPFARPNVMKRKPGLRR